jgi:hypothetical protein
MLGRLHFPFTAKPTQRRRCVTLTTKAGYEITVAEDQRLFALVYNGVPAEAEAQWLKPGLLLALDDQRGEYSGEGCWDAGFLSGCAAAPSHRIEGAALSGKVQECLEIFGVPTLKDFRECSSKDPERGTSAAFVAGYISGLCNVSAIMDPEIGEYSVSFRRSLPTLKMLQRMFLRHGIRSHLNPRDDMPDIVIPVTAIDALAKEVQWFHPRRAAQFASLHGRPPLKHQDEIVSIVPAGVRDVVTVSSGYVGRATVNGFLCVA